MAKDLFPRQRFMSPIIVRGDEKRGVQIWSYGKRAYETLIQLVLNPDYGDITDPETGFDLVIDYTKPNVPGAFPETKITPRRKESLLCDPAYGGPEKCKELLDTIPDFTTLYKRYSTSDVQKILDSALASDESAETSSREIVKGGNKKTAVSSVDEAFEEFSAK